MGQIDLGTLYSGERSLPFGLLGFDPILFILAGNEDMHKISDEFEFWPDRTTELAALERLKISHTLIMGKCCLHASSFIFDRSIFKSAGNQDRLKARTSLISGRIRLLTLELLTFE